jgi:glycerate kinase
MKILIAPNSFKECASSVTIAELISRALRKHGLTDLTLFPVSDGGDGFLDVCRRRFSLEILSLKIHNCYNGKKKRIKIGYDGRTRTAYIESAAVIGLNDVPLDARKPMKMNSAALGEALLYMIMLSAAGSFSIKKIVVGIGGTATNDLGLGLCSVFGLKLFDAGGNSLPVYPENYAKVKTIVLPKRIPLEINVVLDVSVPLTGINGPAKLFSGQKGASRKDALILEKGTKNILRVLQQHYSMDYAGRILGAGGGLGLGISLLTKMRVIRSTEFLEKTMGLTAMIENADIVITGEGNYDRQSALEKATGVVIKEANRRKKRIFLIAGHIEGKKKLPPYVVPVQLDDFFSTSEESIREYRKGIRLAAEDVAGVLDGTQRLTASRHGRTRSGEGF